MKSVEMKPDRPRWERVLTHPTVAAIFLAAVGLGLHHSALSGGWRFDDGALLAAAAHFSPWQYFFVPSVTNLVSGSSNVTPWNVLVYDVNLTLFGLTPQSYYVHALLSLWASAVILYVCAGLWMSRSWAFGVAVLYIVSPVAADMAQQLMVGHYLEGMIFSLLAVIFHFCSYTKPNRMHYAVLAAGCYALSTSCKEVYVPLVCLLPWIAPAGTPTRQRILHTLPAIGVVIGYMAWRYLVLGRLLGGYTESTLPSFSQLIGVWTWIPSLLFGTSAWSTAASVLALAIVTVGLVNGNSRILVLLTLLAVILPLIPLTVFPGIAVRYLFVPWAAFCMISGFVLSSAARQRRLVVASVGVFLFLGLVTLMQANTETIRLQEAGKPMQSLSEFVLRRGMSDAAWILPDSRSGNPAYQDLTLSGIAYASRITTNHPLLQPKIIAHPIQLQYAVNGNRLVHAYDAACECVRPLSSSETEERLRMLGGPFPSGADRLAFRYRFDATDGKLRVEINPFRAGKYFLHIESVLGNSLIFPIKDIESAAFPINQLYYTSRLEVWHLDSQQRLVSSPSLDFSAAQDRYLNWDSTGGSGIEAAPSSGRTVLPVP